jgi:hypothetical protein
MLVELRKHARSNFHFLFTGDETWVFYENPNTHMWVADIGELDKVQRKSHYAKKVMATVFFNGSGQFVLDMMPAGQTMNSKYFATRIIPKLAKLCYPSGRKPHQRRFTAHFDNAPSHCTKEVREAMEGKELLRLEHPAYSPDLAPCDFFLFGYLKVRMKGVEFSCVNTIEQTLSRLIEEIPKETMMRVFDSWMERLIKCGDAGGDYFE